ncbi:MAG: cysteine--tRNA ligase, partial [Mycobacterium leprae]
YDTRARRVVQVGPADGRQLKVYACGPTVYRYAHVGNLRTYLLGDLVRRIAEAARVRTTVVQNITDVGHLADDTAVDATGEDKVLAQARAEGKTAQDLARFYEAAFHRDLAALNVRPADAYPRASESIPLMVDLVARLLERGHAYVGGDRSVFFAARSFPSYGEISGNRLDDLQPGHRVEGTDPAKRFHGDWTLWRRAGANRAMVWPSPWGPGFPGWHVECSAMSLHHLGHSIDLHLGGTDLRFPHHENERAQTSSAVGHEVVRHWVHGEHLLFEGRKMAKSTGNVVLLSDVAARGLDPLALRLAFLAARYRTQLDLTWAALEAADRTLRRWRTRMAEWAEAPSARMDARARREVEDAFTDDLDTPAALEVLRRLEKAPGVPPGSKFETFAHLDRLFGLDFVRDVGRAGPALPPGAGELLAARATARAAKDWGASDRLRDELAALGVAVSDTSTGQRWTLARA